MRPRGATVKSKRSVAVLLIAPVIGLASFLVPAAATARPTKLPAVCIERNLPRGLHLQVGYCP
jgi:hypothetical protein